MFAMRILTIRIIFMIMIDLNHGLITVLAVECYLKQLIIMLTSQNQI